MAVYDLPVDFDMKVRLKLWMSMICHDLPVDAIRLR